jgi:superoxide dismutase, Fe-Mn family
MSHSLPPLQYDYGALEPHIDARTMEIHHTKHHQTYITNLNAALEKAPELRDKSLDELLADLQKVPESIRTAVRNNGGGHWNHTMFWQLMTPDGGGEPGGALSDAIGSSFGDFNQFKEKFGAAALGRFGSGWAWLTVGANGSVAVESTPNQDSPIMEGKKAILGLDVWEHAYYLKYQNRRADYVSAWWNTVNWSEVGKRYGEARG